MQKIFITLEMYWNIYFQKSFVKLVAKYKNLTWIGYSKIIWAKVSQKIFTVAVLYTTHKRWRKLLSFLKFLDKILYLVLVAKIKQLEYYAKYTFHL